MIYYKNACVKRYCIFGERCVINSIIYFDLCLFDYHKRSNRYLDEHHSYTLFLCLKVQVAISILFIIEEDILGQQKVRLNTCQYILL